MTTYSLAPIIRFVLAERGWPYSGPLEALANCLPAVATAGFEIALVEGERIDVQARIRGPEEIQRLVAWLARKEILSEPWRRLRDALALIDERVEEFWLELDATAEDPPLSVFVRVPPQPAGEAAMSLFRVVEVFGVRLSETRRSTLQRCLDASDDDARISHLGLMLGRDGAPIRLIVEGTRPESIADFLARSRWEGSADLVATYLDRLFVHADRIRLALTIADVPMPAIGLECFVGEQGDNDPRWRCLFDMLVRLGLCSDSKRSQILAWPASLTPVSTTSDWPEPLIVQALLRDSPSVRWLECQLSHAKVTIATGQAPSAKAYFGFLESKLNPLGEKSEQPRAGLSDVSAAIDAAVAFLVGARTQAGWWLDYDGFDEGPADEWVTAYVAHALFGSARPDAAGAATRAWRLLSGRDRAGWGWNFLQPADADSTVWGLRLAADLGVFESKAVRHATSFLRRHINLDGGIVTYCRDVYRSWSNGAQVNDGWYESHSCVTAAAALTPYLGSAPLDYLRRMQQSDGAWRGFWWEGHFYATALATEALTATGDPGDVARVARAATAAKTELEHAAAHCTLQERPFETALALHTMLLTRDIPLHEVRRARDSLLGAQLKDGSWKGSAALSIPNKRGEVTPAIDNRRCFTTATILTTLLLLQKAYPEVETLNAN